MKINPIRGLVELFRSFDPSPLKNLPQNHPKKQYCYTLVGLNDKPLTISSLLGLGFVGKIRNSADFISLEGEMLFRELNVVVQIANVYNIHKIRKYHDTGHGIEWESKSRDVYTKLIDAQLFTE